MILKSTEQCLYCTWVHQRVVIKEQNVIALSRRHGLVTRAQETQVFLVADNSDSINAQRADIKGLTISVIHHDHLNRKIGITDRQTGKALFCHRMFAISWDHNRYLGRVADGESDLCARRWYVYPC